MIWLIDIGISLILLFRGLFSACLLSVFPTPLHSIPALDPLTIEFVLNMWSDSWLSGVPEMIYLADDVFSEFG